MKHVGKIICALSSLLLLNACTLYEKPKTPPIVYPKHFKVSLDDHAGLLKNHWWENFNNHELNALVEQSLKTNYQYQIALKNIDIAQTYVDVNMTALFPLMSADFAESRNQSIINVGNGISSAPELSSVGASPPINLSLLSATLSYQLDFWNQAHNAVDQAKANKYSIEANTNTLKLSLVATVVSTYFQLAALNSNIDNLKIQESAAKEALDLLRIQFESGLINESNVLQASTQLETIRSTLNTTVKQRDIQLYGLAYLLGEYPEHFSLKPTMALSEVKFDRMIPEGVPSKVIGMRPDIQYAFGQILAFGYLEKQNIANFLPNFSLTGTFGYASQTFSKLIRDTNAIWTYGMNMSQVLLNYPALLAQYKQSELQYESAILSYKSTIINAFAEVDNALVSFQRDRAILDSFQLEQKNANDQFGIAKAQYDAGLTNYVNYLSNQVAELQSSFNLTNQQLLVTQDIVQSYKAMGLGLEPSS